MRARVGRQIVICFLSHHTRFFSRNQVFWERCSIFSSLTAETLGEEEYFPPQSIDDGTQLSKRGVIEERNHTAEKLQIIERVAK
jgi:hypothetical protein